MLHALASRRPIDTTNRVTIEKPRPGVYRLLVDDEHVGSATFVASGNVVHSCGWGLDDEWQGRGIMTQVLPMLLDELAASGIRAVHTVIAADNEPSQRLATRCGFRRTTQFCTGGHVAAHRWELHLPSSNANDESAS